MQNRRVQLVPGSNGGGSGSVRVMVPNDYLLEDDEEFVINLELMSGSSAFLDISSTIIVIIGDRGSCFEVAVYMSLCPESNCITIT